VNHHALGCAYPSGCGRFWSSMIFSIVVAAAEQPCWCKLPGSAGPAAAVAGCGSHIAKPQTLTRLFVAL
jgi:hypothetical protein